MIWKLIHKFMKDTEDANNIIFAESAWQRAKQLETDVLAQVSDIEADYCRIQLDQTQRIKELESIMLRVAALGVMTIDESPGVGVGRMTYMRESLQAALKGDLSRLEAAEKNFNGDGKANDPG